MANEYIITTSTTGKGTFHYFVGFFKRTENSRYGDIHVKSIAFLSRYRNRLITISPAARSSVVVVWNN